MNTPPYDESGYGKRPVPGKARVSGSGRAVRRGSLASVVAGLTAMMVATGCASTKVTSRQALVTEQLPRPACVWVYDFAATAAEISADSAFASQRSADATFQTAEDASTGRLLGAQIAADLVGRINGLGVPAQRVVAGVVPQVNDILIRGCLISFDEGNAAKRVVVGVGRGASELSAAVEGFQVTAQGLRRLGAGTTESGSNKTPGAALGVATLIATSNPAGLIVSSGMKIYGEKSGRSKVEGRASQTAKEIAAVLRVRFQQQGWIP